MIFKVILFVYILIKSFQSNEIDDVWIIKYDETVKKMLSLKGDIFPNYNIKNFEKYIETNGNIINKSTISNTRILYEFEKN